MADTTFPTLLEASIRLHTPKMPDGDHSEAFRAAGSTVRVDSDGSSGFVFSGAMLVESFITEGGWSTATGHVTVGG